MTAIGEKVITDEDFTLYEISSQHLEGVAYKGDNRFGWMR